MEMLQTVGEFPKQVSCFLASASLLFVFSLVDLLVKKPDKASRTYTTDFFSIQTNQPSPDGQGKNRTYHTYWGKSFLYFPTGTGKV